MSGVGNMPGWKKKDAKLENKSKDVNSNVSEQQEQTSEDE